MRDMLESDPKCQEGLIQGISGKCLLDFLSLPPLSNTVITFKRLVVVSTFVSIFFK